MVGIVAGETYSAGNVLAEVREEFGDYMADYLMQGVKAGVLVADDSLREVAVQLAHEWSKDAYANAGNAEAYVAGEA